MATRNDGDCIDCGELSPVREPDGRCQDCAIEHLEEQKDALVAQVKRRDDAISEVLGAQHNLKYALGFIRRWRKDPNFNPDDQIKRAEDAIGEWHRRLVAATK